MMEIASSVTGRKMVRVSHMEKLMRRRTRTSLRRKKRHPKGVITSPRSKMHKKM